MKKSFFVRGRSPPCGKVNSHLIRTSNLGQWKVHPAAAGLVIGNRDMEANAVSLRVHGKGNLGAKPRGEVIAEILDSIRLRRG